MFAILNKAVTVATRSFLSLIALFALLPVAVIGFCMVAVDDGIGEAINAVYVLYADIYSCLHEWIFED